MREFSRCCPPIHPKSLQTPHCLRGSKTPVEHSGDLDLTDEQEGLRFVADAAQFRSIRGNWKRFAADRYRRKATILACFGTRFGW
jgi:hypothetical protein